MFCLKKKEKKSVPVSGSDSVVVSVVNPVLDSVYKKHLVFAHTFVIFSTYKTFVSDRFSRMFLIHSKNALVENGLYPLPPLFGFLTLTSWHE